MVFGGCFGGHQDLEASVTWMVSDNGFDLTFQTYGGTLDLGNVDGAVWVTGDGHFPISYIGGANPDINRANPGLYMISQEYFFLDNAGDPSGFGPFLAEDINAAFEGAGPTFGFEDDALLWGVEFGSPVNLMDENKENDIPKPISAVISPDSTFLVEGFTVASMFGESLDNGPVLLWTHRETGDSIYLSKAIPEPSVGFLFLAGFILLGARRRT